MHFTLMWFEKKIKIEEQKKKQIKNLPLASEKKPQNKPLGVCDIKNKIKLKKIPNNREIWQYHNH